MSMTDKKEDCKDHTRFQMLGGELMCIVCGGPSDSEKWRHNVFGAQGAKAVEKGKTGNKQVAPQANK